MGPVNLTRDWFTPDERRSVEQYQDAVAEDFAASTPADVLAFKVGANAEGTAIGVMFRTDAGEQWFRLATSDPEAVIAWFSQVTIAVETAANRAAVRQGAAGSA